MIIKCKKKKKSFVREFLLVFKIQKGESSSSKRRWAGARANQRQSTSNHVKRKRERGKARVGRESVGEGSQQEEASTYRKIRPVNFFGSSLGLSTDRNEDSLGNCAAAPALQLKAISTSLKTAFGFPHLTLSLPLLRIFQLQTATNSNQTAGASKH